ncbi:MAG: MFS transporter [candidate division WOR-3 bacterium]|nr:MAG: MFS transporter [candidate division WOR-3 bacterium]
MKKIIPQGYSTDIWVVFFARIVTAIGFSVSMPYLSLYLHNELGIPMTIVGTILMCASVVGAVLGVYGGELSDRRGRKWVMVRALSWRCLIFMLMGYVIAKKADVYIITGLLILNSAFGSFFLPASMSYVADLTAEEKRTSAYGLLRIGGNLGWALGPAIGGFLATIDYAYLFYFTGMCMLIATSILIKYSKESLSEATLSEKKRTSFKNIISVAKDTRFLLFTIICLVLFIAWGQLIYPLAVYSVNRVGITKTQLGLLFSLNGFMVVAFQYFITNFIPVKRLLTALWIGSLIYAVGYFSVGVANSFWFLFASVIVITIGEMIVSPSSLSYASIIADVHHKGRYLGFFNLSQSLGWSFAPLVGGVLLDTFPGRSLGIWGIIGAFALIAAGWFILFERRSLHNK